MARAPHGGKGSERPLRFGVPDAASTARSPYASLRIPEFRHFIVGLFALTVVMCVISAMAAIVKITRIDPAMVFAR